MDLSSEKSRFDLFVESEKAIEEKLGIPVINGIDKAMDVSMGLERGKKFPPFGIINIDEKYDDADKIFDLANSLVVNAKATRDKLESLPINSKQLINMVTTLNEFDDSPMSKDIKDKTGEDVGTLVKYVEEIKNGNNKIEDFDSLKGFNLPDIENIIKSSIEDFLSSLGIRRDDYSQTNIDRSKQILQNFNSTSVIEGSSNINSASSEIANRVENLTSLNTENTSVNNEGNYFEGTNTLFGGSNTTGNINNSANKNILSESSLTNLQTHNAITGGVTRNTNNTSIGKDQSTPTIKNEVSPISIVNEIKPTINRGIVETRANSLSNDNISTNTSPMLELNKNEPRIEKNPTNLNIRTERNITPQKQEQQEEILNNSTANPNQVQSLIEVKKEDSPQLSKKETEEKTIAYNQERIEKLLIEISNKLSQPLSIIDSKINYS